MLNSEVNNSKVQENASNVQANAIGEQAKQGQSQNQGESQSPVEELKKALDEAFREKKELLSKLGKLKGRLAYKKSEGEALAKLAILDDKYKNIGKLKHAKEVLEFKIATEAKTLEDEKLFLKRLAEVEKELKDAIASQRLRNKAELINKDIEEINKSIEEVNKQIDQANAKINELKAKLKALTRPKEKEPKRSPEPLKISLEDIAIIKTKKKQGDEQNQAQQQK